MLPMTYVTSLLVVNIICNEAPEFNNYFAIQINEYPKSSCHEISSIERKFRCLGTCLNTMDMLVMISHDESTKTCMCCSDITGSDITGPNWKSYVPHTCKYLFFFNQMT